MFAGVWSEPGYGSYGGYYRYPFGYGSSYRSPYGHYYGKRAAEDIEPSHSPIKRSATAVAEPEADPGYSRRYGYPYYGYGNYRGYNSKCT